MTGLQNTELLDFTGGMNTVTAPHLLPYNEAIQLTNANVNFGSLKSLNILNFSQAAQADFFVEYRGILYWYDEWRSNAMIDDKLYWSNGIDTGKILPDGRELPLGIETPSTFLTQTESGTVGEGVHKGDFKYTYTFYSSTTGVESAPAPLTTYVNPNEQNVELSGFVALPEQADRYRLYRIGGYLARFTLVATITDSDVPYIDSIDDTLIDGRLLQTLRSGPPPPGIQNFVELNGRLYGSVEHKVYYSGLGAPDSWYVDDFFTMPNTVIGLAKSPAGIMVMGRAYTYLLFGAAPSSFRIKVISDYLGCVSNKSIAYYNSKAIWLGVDGLYTSDGYSILNLTYRKIQQISDLAASSACIVNDVYYLSFKPFLIPGDDLYPSDTLYPGRILGVDLLGEAQGMISMDFKRGQGYSYQYLNYPNALSTGIYKGGMYVVVNGEQSPVNCNTKFDCSSPFCLGDTILAQLQTDNLSDPYKELEYLSPQLIDGSFSTLKEYDKVRINYRGQFDITVIFSNGDIAIEETISSPRVVTNDITLQEEQDSVAVIGIPNGHNKSFSIQFKVVGKGLVKSIQYSWLPREGV